MTVPAQPPVRHGGLPVVNRALIGNEVRRAKRQLEHDLSAQSARRASSAGSSAPERLRMPVPRLLLLRAAPVWDDEADLLLDDGLAVRVVAAPTVLAALEAYERFDAETAGTSFVRVRSGTKPQAWPPPTSVLVLLTPCGDHELGTGLLAHAVEHTVRLADPLDLVRETYQVRRIDPALRDRPHRWVGDALLRASTQVKQLVGGWPRSSAAVLDLDGAMRRLVAIRFARSEDTPAEGQLDAAGLLEWSTDAPAVERYLGLETAERDGLAEWLATTAGPVAKLILRIVLHGQAADAVPLGLVASVLTQPELAREPLAMTTMVRVEERFLGGSAMAPADWRAFGEVAESLLLRRQDAVRGGSHGEHGETETRRIRARAEAILAELHAASLAQRSDLLPSGFRERLIGLAEQLRRALPAPTPAGLVLVEQALARLREHRTDGVEASGESRAAVAAVRLARWLAGSDDETYPADVGWYARQYVREWAWVDRAAGAVPPSTAGPEPTAEAADVFRSAASLALRRRRRLDHAFAVNLGAPEDDVLHASEVMERIVRPMAAKGAPLLVVIERLDAATAYGIAEEIVRARWVEVGRREDGREGVLAPDGDAAVRAAVLGGTADSHGDAAVPDDLLGLDSYGPVDEEAAFRRAWHGRSAGLFGPPKEPPPPFGLEWPLIPAIRDPSLVVAAVLRLDDPVGRVPKQAGGPRRLGDVAGLDAALAEARLAGRPVVVVSGGLEEKGRDASGLAARILPVLTFVPGHDLKPSSWSAYEPRHAPAWWDSPVEVRPPHAPARGVGVVDVSVSGTVAAGDSPAVAAAPGLFDPAEAMRSLGARVVRSRVYTGQRAGVRQVPADERVAAVIDALADAGGALPVASVARVAAQPPVRMRGYLAQLSRLLNVEAYGVLTTRDEGATVQLNVPLLREQFLPADAGEPQ